MSSLGLGHEYTFFQLNCCETGFEWLQGEILPEEVVVFNRHCVKLISNATFHNLLTKYLLVTYLLLSYHCIKEP